MTTAEDQDALDELEFSIRAILPETYQDTYDDVQPVSMGSAALRFDPEGRVAWNEMWGSFCDLAMAGGPPHKGVWLAPGPLADVSRELDRQAHVMTKICRGITLAAALPAHAAPTPGWVRVSCASAGMAGWLARAVVMENVAARAVGTALDVPAGPAFRLEKEIKNVITSVTKTSHYWTEHVPDLQQRSIASMFARMGRALPLVEPVYEDDRVEANQHELECTHVADAVYAATGLRRSAHRQIGWVGLEGAGVRGAIWIMRALIVANILARREGSVLLVPIHPRLDPDGSRVVGAVTRFHHLASVAGAL